MRASFGEACLLVAFAATSLFWFWSWDTGRGHIRSASRCQKSPVIFHGDPCHGDEQATPFFVFWVSYWPPKVVDQEVDPYPFPQDLNLEIYVPPAPTCPYTSENVKPHIPKFTFCFCIAAAGKPFRALVYRGRGGASALASRSPPQNSPPSPLPPQRDCDRHHW